MSKYKSFQILALVSLGLVPFMLARAGGTDISNTEVPVLPSTPLPASPGWSEIPAPGSFYLLMNKQKNELTARSLSDAQKVFGSFRAISGTNSGDKIKEGDKKTPEGIYFVEYKVSKSRLRSIHGPQAFALNYPNAVDRIFKRTGRGIWIHGVENDRRLEKRFDTLGCVAVSNRDILDIGTHLTMKATPIVIIDEEKPDSPVGVMPQGSALYQRVMDWAKAWSSKDADAYLSFYSQDFYSQKMDFSAWSKYKRRLASTYKSIQVNLEDLKILKHGKYSVAIFYQDYKSNRFAAKSRKRLYLVGNDDSKAQILAEEVAQEESAQLLEDKGVTLTSAPSAGSAAKVDDDEDDSDHSVAPASAGNAQVALPPKVAGKP